MRGHEQVAKLRQVGVQDVDLVELGQVLPLVGELGEPYVERLDVEKADLVSGRGVQFGAPEG
ncbi:hypothetical protein FHS42_000283 [Streptomyces zagrosensis]|uniref:Uncharacterized protein n=1 Tax=Streptomyces zagrosensis TaxID=1042984 RepID=A0A7W9Q496_9ACTN|nr:hypothetical protein [Streptomyces zagrosensis]